MQKKIKILKYFLIMIFWALCPLIAGCSVSEEAKTEEEDITVTVYFFHDTACGSCDGTKEFRELVAEQLEPYRQSCPYELSLFNIFKNFERENAAAVLEEHDVEMGSLHFPAAMIDGRVYEGMDMIRQNLRKDFLNRTELKVLYFYRDDCDECNQLKPYLKSLPKEVIVDGESVPLRVEMLASRSGNNGEALRQFFAEKDVPEEKQMVPFMVLGDQYLTGADEIRRNMLPMLEQGCGLHFSQLSNGYQARSDTLIKE